MPAAIGHLLLLRQRQLPSHLLRFCKAYLVPSRGCSALMTVGVTYCFSSLC